MTNDWRKNQVNVEILNSLRAAGMLNDEATYAALEIWKTFQEPSKEMR